MREKKNMRYGQFLRSKRIADSRELTLRDIAEELGVSVSISAMLNRAAGNPSMRRRQKSWLSSYSSRKKTLP